MFKQLSSGVKVSIKRSISTSLEYYLASIDWDNDKFSMEEFVAKWEEYFTENAAWYDKVPQDVLMSNEFQEELGQKIDEVIAKIFNDKPTKTQIDTIEKMQKQLGTNFTYNCKVEAAYIEQKLKDQLKKKTNVS